MRAFLRGAVAGTVVSGTVVLLVGDRRGDDDGLVGLTGCGKQGRGG